MPIVPRPERRKINEKKAWYRKLSNHIVQPHTLLLNIYESEVLIPADIGTFNRVYHTAIKFSGDVTRKEQPKEFLIQKTRKERKVYAGSQCPDLFA